MTYKRGDYEGCGVGTSCAPESPQSHGMTEELLTSRFGSHESVCKPYTVRTVIHNGRSREREGGGGGGGKLDQIRRNITKILGEFSVREHVFYGAIFLSMTVIVMFCFLLVNRTQSASSSFLPYQGSLDHTCSVLVDPYNGKVHQTGRYYGDRAIYTCDSGYQIVGNEERVCQDTGLWSDSEPYCKKKVYCAHPPRVQHGSHNGPTDAAQFPLETVLKYTCYPGYLAVGFAHAKCFLYNTTAQWFGPDLTCKPITCGEPEDIPAGILERKCQTFGCRISYTCEPGYQLVGRNHRYCQADGSWSPQLLPECKPVSCPTPSHPSFGRVMFNSVTYNSLISYECNYGYMIIGESVRRCDRSKEWTGLQPICREINCGSPGILPNGWLEGSRTTLHAVVTFRCEEGMTFSGPSYRTICQADGRWSHPVPRCYAPCIVPYISHGYIEDRASGSIIGHNQSVTVSCVSQFQPSHNASVVCNNGTWTRIAKCIPAKCTELPDAPRNGMVVAPNMDHGMVGKFECRDGYMLKGNNTTQCYFGNWTGMTPWCKEVYCPFPGFIEHGKILLIGNMGLYEYRPYVRKIQNGRQIMFQCDRGYSMIEPGPSGATCIAGEWSPPQLPRCVEGSHPSVRLPRSVPENSNVGDQIRNYYRGHRRLELVRRLRRLSLKQSNNNN